MSPSRVISCALALIASTATLAATAQPAKPEPEEPEPGPEQPPPPPTPLPPEPGDPGAAPAVPSELVPSELGPTDDKEDQPPAAGPPPAPQPQPPPGTGPQPPPGYPPYPYPYPPPPGQEGYPPYYPYSPYYYPPGQYGYPGAYLQRRPKTLPYVEGEQPPPGYALESRVYRGLVIAGATTFGSLYLLSAAVGAAFQDERDGDEHAPMFAPLVGPFITIGTVDATGFATFALIVDGLGQAAGLGMFIGGLTAERKVWARKSVGVELDLKPTLGGLTLEGKM